MHGLVHKGAGTSALFSKKRKQQIIHPAVISRKNYVYSPNLPTQNQTQLQGAEIQQD